jgi:hypothetical protein
MPDTARIRVSVFDGARKPIGGDLDVLVSLRDGQNVQVHSEHHEGFPRSFEVPFHNNLQDNYSVVVWAKKHLQAGVAPVHVSKETSVDVDLMLLPKRNRFDFAEATWDRLATNAPDLRALLARGVSNAVARDRYSRLLNDFPGSLAAFLNITTALRDILLPVGRALTYYREVTWEEKLLRQDRFFGYAELALVEQVKRAADHGQFEPQFGLDITHPGATSSFKQVQFGEANVQITFHEDDVKTVDGETWVKVESDMDYFRSPLAHLLLEVLPNTVSKGATDPRKIYMLRWIAGRRAGIPELAPLYTIVPR